MNGLGCSVTVTYRRIETLDTASQWLQHHCSRLGPTLGVSYIKLIVDLQVKTPLPSVGVCPVPILQHKGGKASNTTFRATAENDSTWRHYSSPLRRFKTAPPSYSSPLRSFKTALPSYSSPLRSLKATLPSYASPLRSFKTALLSYSSPLRSLKTSLPSLSLQFMISWPSSKAIYWEGSNTSVGKVQMLKLGSEGKRRERTCITSVPQGIQGTGMISRFLVMSYSCAKQGPFFEPYEMATLKKKTMLHIDNSIRQSLMFRAPTNGWISYIGDLHWTVFHYHPQILEAT